MNLNAVIEDPNPIGWRFDNTYSRLSEAFFAPAKPSTVSAPRLVILNHRLADDLGLDLTRLSPEAAASLFTGQDLPSGSLPIAQAYAGHQFGNFTMLGDGRAILLGEQLAPDGERFDVQLKGAGPTPFSRRGDGRARRQRGRPREVRDRRVRRHGAGPSRGAARISETISRHRRALPRGT